MNTEHLNKALDDVQFLEEDLRRAYTAAIEEGLECGSLLLLDQIEIAAKLRNRLRQIKEAIGLEIEEP